MLNSETRSCGGFWHVDHPIPPTTQQMRSALQFWHERVINNLSNPDYTDLFFIAATQLTALSDENQSAQLLLPMREAQA